MVAMALVAYLPNIGDTASQKIQKRTISDLRAIGTAIESYQVDNGVPPNVPGHGVSVMLLEPSLVPTFISRNLEFRNEGDTRKSLAAVGQSEILQQWNAEAREKLDAAVKTLSDKGRIVGVISSMRGRVQGLELFGSRRLLTERQGGQRLD